MVALIALVHAKIHAQDLVLVVVLALEVEEVAIHATVTALVRVKVVLELVAIVLADAQEGVMENVQNHVIPDALVRVKVAEEPARVPARTHVQHTVNIIPESKNEQHNTRKIKSMGGRAF